MKAIAGAAAASMIVLAFWLCPPAHDPAVLVMPSNLAVLAAIGELTLVGGGAMMFLWAVFS